MYPIIRAFALSTLLVLVFTGAITAAGPQVSATNNLASMPLAFTENQGQWDDQVKFRTDAGGATMWFTPGGAHYQFTKQVSVAADDDWRRGDHELDEFESMIIGVSFIGANSNPRLVGVDVTGYKCNYFIGNNRSKWCTDVPNYRAVVYKDIYPGIDLKYYGNGNQMEYDWVVPPFADYSQIKIHYDGSLSMSVSSAGELLVHTRWGTVVEQRPVIYQVVNNLRLPVEGEYVLEGDNCFGFKITGDYDRSLPVVIDPLLKFSTYLGDSGAEYSTGIKVDGSGRAYVAGYTYSTEFPTLNPYQTDQGGVDVFVTKLNSSGNGLEFSTYLGGSGTEYGFVGIAIDASGCAYITGGTSSTDFPTQNPFQTAQGGIDAFVTKLNSSGNALIYSTYLAGSDNDMSCGIAVDVSGAAFVTGRTRSTDFLTENPFQTHQGVYDVFVAKLNSTGSGLVYGTYLGGTDNDYGYSIAVDGSGCACVTGYTYSTDFPTENPFQTDQGTTDAFVAKLNSAGNGLVYSTYLGGSNAEYGFGITADGLGCAFVTGYTYSTDFPTENPFQANLQGDRDAFVTKLGTAGNSLVYSTYLGGSDDETGYAVAIDGEGCAFVTGITHSTDFPVENSIQAHLDTMDVFVTKLNGSGNSLVYSTYLCGDYHDIGRGIAVDSEGSAYITGHTVSTNFPTLNPYQDTLRGTWDAFVTKLTADTADFSIGNNYPVGYYPLSIVAADLDGDEDQDLAVADYESDSISILFNNGDGTFGPDVNYGTGNGPRAICAADVENDGDVDLAVANALDNNVSVFINNGSGVFAAAVNYAAGTGPVAICTGYLNNDAFVDLIVANFSADSITILFNDGDGTFDGITDGVVGYGAGNGPRSVHTADLDNDGDQDVAVANELDDDVSIYINNGTGKLRRDDDIAVGDSPVCVTGGNLNDDSYHDLVTANFNSDDLSVLLNEGDGTYDAMTDGVVGYGAGNGPRSVDVADLDADGAADLIAANELSDDISILHNNGDGTFADAETYPAGDGPAGVVADDLDGDGDNDLAVVNCESDDVSILFNLRDESICCEIRGDFDHNGSFTPLDAIALVSYLWSGGDGPVCDDEVDVNDSGGVDPMDAIYIVNYFWLGGPAPVPCP